MAITGQERVARAFEKHLEEQIARAYKRLIRSLSVVGEKCNNKAREKGSYEDQTGNLRSSTGYIIIDDGKVIRQGGFEPVKGGDTGSSVGKDYIMSLVKLYPRGIVLVVVAGMNYAAYVSAKGYDVLESSELLADKLVPQMLSKLGFK